MSRNHQTFVKVAPGATVQNRLQRYIDGMAKPHLPKGAYGSTIGKTKPPKAIRKATNRNRTKQAKQSRKANR